MHYGVIGAGGCFAIDFAEYAMSGGARITAVGRNPLRGEEFSLGIQKNQHYRYHVAHLIYEFEELCDILDVTKPEIIVNFAAQGEGAKSWEKSWRFFDTNCSALVRLCEFLRSRHWFKRFVHVGTSELYGSVDAPAKEDWPIRPSSPYAASKAAFDLYLQSVSRYLQFPMNIIRPSNAYCPGQGLHRLIPNAILCAVTGDKFHLQGGGVAQKSYIHARDLSIAIKLIVERGKVGKTYNCGPENPVSIRDVAERCCRAVGVEPEAVIHAAPSRLGQDSRYWLDSTELRADCGWSPRIDWDSGLNGMVEWVRRYLPALAKQSREYVVRA